MSFLRNVYLRLLGAVQFLTVIPIEQSTVPVSESAPFFPLVGALIGLVPAGILLVLHLPAGLEAALALAAQLAVTGLLHEDGLADIADGVRKGRTRERMFEIIKDSRLGTYGSAALFMTLLVRWQGLAALSEMQAPWVLPAIEGLSRCVLLWLGAITPAARPGMGAYLSEHSSMPMQLASFVQAGILLWLVGWPHAAWLGAGLVVLTLLARQYFVARLGGVVGDCFGALQQVAACYGLSVVAWTRF